MAIPYGSTDAKNVWSLLQEGRKLARKRDFESALRAFTDAIKSVELQIRCPRTDDEPPYRPYFEALYERGLAALHAKKFDQALHDFAAIVAAKQTITAFDPANKRCKNLVVHAHIGLGSTHLRQGAFALAIEDFTQALRLEPNCFEAVYSRALAYRSLGEPDKADDDFHTASKIDARAFGSLQPYYRSVRSRTAGMTTPEGRFRTTMSDAGG